MKVSGVSDSDTRQMTVFSLLTLNHCLLDCSSFPYQFLNQHFSSGGNYKNGGMVLRRNLKAYSKAKTELELV